jgi:ABC-2 type transport system ATP-binding protein
MDDTSAADVLVRVRNLTKHYGSIRAVDGVSFDARRGDLLGFLGPNGAGKTTVMKIITGFLEPDAGEVLIAGMDVRTNSLDAKRKIGYLPENAPAYGEMTVEGFLAFIAAARQVEEPEAAIDRAIALTELKLVRHQSVDTLSKGFKRRVGLAQALLHDPEILILDEPTDGLDPNQKALVQDLLASLSEGRCIILSTHILDEAEKICNRAVIISQGLLIEDSTPEELIRKAPSHNMIRLTVSEETRARIRTLLTDQDWCERLEDSADRHLDIYPRGGENHLSELAPLLEGLDVQGVNLREGRLDELFREVTKGVAA